MLVISEEDIVLGQSAQNKQEAIALVANLMAERELVTTSYIQGMLHREQQASTYLDSGIAIPHGTLETRDQVLQTGVQIVQFPDGVIWGDEGQKAYVAIGIAASSDQHLDILRQVTRILGQDTIEQQLRDAVTNRQIVNLFTKTDDRPPSADQLVFDAALIEQALPARNLLELIASGCALLHQRQLINNDFIAQQVVNDPIFIGKGLWLAAGDNGVNTSSVALLTVAHPFQHNDLPVHGLLMVASADRTTLPVFEQLAELICEGRLGELLPSVEQKVALLTGNLSLQSHSPTRLQPPIEPLPQPEAHVFTIVNPHGLHARPSALLLTTIKQFKSAIQVANATEGSAYRDARSLPNLMGLGLRCGDKIAFIAEGVDAEAAIMAIGEAIHSGLGEHIA